ncbi:hypothetical protein QNI16_27990 [Cytophagaceae bacterium YF14B1]|uniref:Lipocalin-like domain-containing protein n=1 Tax=Xanthocytophaga flava TaxID=3048013 RepID=A0AAE3QSY6_9BACT|nr:hypothetical protein [Xanthocytophaga flavus]MDJ1484371.1 hypothetical protein [Xanthocytophaga flavus]
MKFQKFIMIIGAFIFLLSCKKEEAPKTTRTELLTNHSWKINQVLANGTPVTDDAIQLILGSESSLAQLTRSSIIFKTDNTYTGTDQQTDSTFTDTWYFIENESKIRLKAKSDTLDFTIDVLSEKQLNLSTRYTVSGITPTIVLQLVP